MVGEPVDRRRPVSFDVAYNGVEVDVAHTGTPPDMFQPGIPVVVEGHWRDGAQVFDSDRMLDQARRELRGQGRLRRAHSTRPSRAAEGSARVNAALGTAGIVLGVAASLGGVADAGVRPGAPAPHLLAIGRSYVLLALVGAVLAVAAMERALITRDFTVQYVADNGSSRTPALYNVATLWAALEGSILLWVLVLTGYMALVVHKFRKRLDDPLVGWAMLTMLVVSGVLLPAAAVPGQPVHGVRPARRLRRPGAQPAAAEPPAHGGAPAGALPGLRRVHRAVRLRGRRPGDRPRGRGLAMETRRWTLFAWGFLTFGIVLGAWWSYEVLNWGGYWGWDPVENASLLPWLTGTAFLHSVMVQERRGMLRVWNLSLVCATFSLTILGTFLTRSGVIASVHAFTEGSIGAWLLGFFGLTVAVTLGLIGWRGDRLRSPGRIDSPISREGAFLANNVLFAGFAFVVLLGTVFPLLVEAANDEQLSVGSPYFDRMTIPIGLTLLFLMAVAPVLPWRKASTELLAQRLFWPAWAGTAAVVVAVLLGARGLAPLLAFGLGGFAAGAAVRQVVLATRRQGWRGLVGRTNGGMVVHVGVVLIAVAMAASGSYDTERELTMEVGDTASVAGHEIEYLGGRTVEQSNKTSIRAQVGVDGTCTSRPSTCSPRPASRSARRRWPPRCTEDVYLTLLQAPGRRRRPDGRPCGSSSSRW